MENSHVSAQPLDIEHKEAGLKCSCKVLTPVQENLM